MDPRKFQSDHRRRSGDLEKQVVGEKSNRITLKSFANFSPGLRFGKPWKLGFFFEAATLKELRRLLLIVTQSFRVAKSSGGLFEPRFSKQTLGWN
jgi:hypothetical protein